MLNSFIRAVASVAGGSSSGNASNTSKKGAFQEIHELYPIELVLGDEEKGIDLIDSSYPITSVKDYQRRIADPITVDGLTFASLASRRDSEIYGTMWSDYRTDRSLGYDLKTAKPTALPTLRVLDAAVGRVVKDVNHLTRGVILSCSDGYDHPIEPREQQEIGKTACMVSREMVHLVFKELFHLDTEHDEDDVFAGIEGINSPATGTEKERDHKAHNNTGVHMNTHSKNNSHGPQSHGHSNVASSSGGGGGGGTGTTPIMDEDFLYNSPEGLAARDRDRDKRMRPKIFYDITENIPMPLAARDVGEIAKDIGSLVHDQVTDRGVMTYVGVGNVTVAAQLKIPFQTLMSMQLLQQQQSSSNNANSSANTVGGASTGNRGSISLPPAHGHGNNPNPNIPQVGSSFAAPPGVGLGGNSIAMMNAANNNNGQNSGPLTLSPPPPRAGEQNADPDSDPTLSSGYYYEVKTISVGDCLAFAFIPDPVHPSIIQLSYPMDFAEPGFGGGEEFQPASITRWRSYQVDVNSHNLPAGAIIFTVTDGVWDKFRKMTPKKTPEQSSKSVPKGKSSKEEEGEGSEQDNKEEKEEDDKPEKRHEQGEQLGGGRSAHYVTYEGKEYKYIHSEIDLEAIRDCLAGCVSSSSSSSASAALAAANTASNAVHVSRSQSISHADGVGGKGGKKGKDKDKDGDSERDSFGSRGSFSHSRSFRLSDVLRGDKDKNKEKEKSQSVSVSATGGGKEDIDAVYAAYYASLDPNHHQVMPEPSVKDFINCLRDETVKRAEKLRHEYDQVMTTLREFALSLQTDSVLRERFLTRDLASTKMKSKPWKDCQDDSVLPEKVKNAANRLCELEHFRPEVVPFLALLEFRPSLGDDCTIMAAKLPLVEKELIRSLVEVSTVTTYKKKKLQMNISKQFELVKKWSSLLLSQSSSASTLDSPLPLYELIDDMTGETYEELVPNAYKQCSSFVIHKGLPNPTATSSSNNTEHSTAVIVKKKYDPNAINAVTDLVDDLYAMHIQEERERSRQNSKSWFG